MNVGHTIGDQDKNTEQKYLHVAFNQDDSCFSCSSNTGFEIFNTYPLQRKIAEDLNAGIGYSMMLYRTNYISLIGGGQHPAYSLNKVVIWDDLLKKVSIKLSFMSMVRAVFLSRVHIVVVLNDKLSVFSFNSAPVRLVSDIEIPVGSSVDFKMNKEEKLSGVLVFESTKYRGQIHIAHLNRINEVGSLPTSIVKAHKTDIKLLKLNHQGNMVATCSKKGTIVRIFNVSNGEMIHEFRRGLDNAEIYDMEFSPHGNKLAVISDKQTIHIFNVNNDEAAKAWDTVNRVHFLKGVIPKKLNLNYLESTWSMCSKHLLEESTVGEGNCKIGWCNDNMNKEDDSFVLIWKDNGIWEKYVIMEKEIQQPRQYSVNESLKTSSKKIKEWEIVRESWRKL